MYEHINNITQLAEMELKTVVEFHNYYQQKINDKEFTKDEFKDKFNFTMYELYKYIFASNQYTTKKGLFIPGTPRSRNRKEKQKPTLTDREILFIKNLVKNGLDDLIDIHTQELINEKDKKNICIQLTKSINEQFENYINTHRRFNKSQHIMIALLEYMNKYK